MGMLMLAVRPHLCCEIFECIKLPLQLHLLLVYNCQIRHIVLQEYALVSPQLQQVSYTQILTKLFHGQRPGAQLCNNCIMA